MTLTPEVRDLLTAIAYLDERTHDLAHDRDTQRSIALAYCGGLLAGVLEAGVSVRHATAVIGAWQPKQPEVVP
jgi:hypothetical protein